MQPLPSIYGKVPVVGISAQAKELIDKFETRLSDSLKTEVFTSTYVSIDDILIRKYHLADNISEMDFPDFSDKTEFIPKAVRGNIQKAEGKILTYKEATAIVDKGLNEEMP